jgi:hypothetical protein
LAGGSRLRGLLRMGPGAGARLDLRGLAAAGAGAALREPARRLGRGKKNRRWKAPDA